MLSFAAFSIKQKLRLMIVAASGLAVLVVCLIFLYFAQRWFGNDTQHELTTLADLISSSCEAPLEFEDPSNAKLAIEYLRANPNIVAGCIYQTNGTIYAQYVRKGTDFKAPTYAPREQYQPQSLELVKSIYNVEGKFLGTLYLKSDIELEKAFLRQCLIVLGASVLIAALVAFFLAEEFQRFVTGPILKLLHTTKTVYSESNYSIRAVRFGQDEISDLVDGFNKMLEQIQLRDDELRKYHEQLEEQVARRTADLSDAYRNLVESYERLKKLESLRDNLTHMIVHDLRSPLMAMMQSAGLLKMMAGAKLDAEELDYLSQFSQTCAQMAEMINSLLDIGRLEAGEMPLNLAACDMRMLAELAVEHLKPLIGPRGFVCNFPKESASICCDPDLIRRVISNLTGNALKYTSDNGRVELKIEVLPECVKFSAIDNGLGVPREFHQKIFQKFGQVENRKLRNSTGLGLAFCKLAVEAHEGQIGVESEINKGSNFWFTLPARRPSAVHIA